MIPKVVMNPYNTIIAAVLAIIATILFITFFPKPCDKSKEKFEDIVSNFTSCPPKSTVFTNKDGTTLCCDGEVNNRICSGKIKCAISTNSDGIPLCNKIIAKEYNAQAVMKCPISMPYYFIQGTPGKEYCTSSKLNSANTEPLDKSASMCSFENYMFDIRNPKSCEVQRMYDAVMCPKEPCSKHKINLMPNTAVVIQVSYTDNEGVPRTCNDDKSMQNYYNDIKKDLSQNNINLCSVSKKVFIDGTMKINETTN